jgi:hypothetical protein
MSNATLQAILKANDADLWDDGEYYDLDQWDDEPAPQDPEMADLFEQIVDAANLQGAQ